MAADDEIKAPADAASDTLATVESAPLWRRVAGGVLMGLGAVLLAGFVSIGLVVALTFIEWRVPFDGLATVGMVCGPFIAGGLVLIALGRWFYGGWRSGHPILTGAAAVLPFIGVAGAFFAIGMFFRALFDETGRGGAWAFSQFVLSILASLLLVAIGFVLKRRASAR